MMPGSLTAQDDPMGILEDIPEGGNRIIMIQEGVPPADVYVDALISRMRGFSAGNSYTNYPNTIRVDR